MNIWKKIWLEARDTVKNIFDRKSEILYIVEKIDWAIYWDGVTLTDEFRKLGYRAAVRRTARGARNKILHFGSAWTFVSEKGIKKPHVSNKIVLTAYYIEERNPRLQFFSEVNKAVEMIHTSARKPKEILTTHGIDVSKTVVIPLGIDLTFFPLGSEEKRTAVRKELGISEDAFVIGSFQKDGNGLGEGNTPKLIKGPDIFCDALQKLPEPQKTKVHILLAGPARGYVKKRLKEAGIAFTDLGFIDYHETAKYYHTLDCYVVASRAEGGPKALLEAWATGVPLVSTDVGMVSDFLIDGANGLLVPVEDSEKIAECVLALMHDKDLRAKLVREGFRSVQAFENKKIATRYVNEIYKKIAK
ncbi:MAG TPA: glycosyltransferase family 4 protein [Candidatus Paceibacterota bacterium]|nr:glycosyltransferase family 4 protein [Candidatus Paceibacterota bacterium]